jgi:hypothetical protein
MPAPETRALPLDIDTMRACADRLLAEDAELPSLEELELLTLPLRGHIVVVVPEVEARHVSPNPGCRRLGPVFARGWVSGRQRAAERLRPSWSWRPALRLAPLSTSGIRGGVVGVATPDVSLAREAFT